MKANIVTKVANTWHEFSSKKNVKLVKKNLLQFRRRAVATYGGTVPRFAVREKCLPLLKFAVLYYDHREKKYLWCSGDCFLLVHPVFRTKFVDVPLRLGRRLRASGAKTLS